MFLEKIYWVSLYYIKTVVAILTQAKLWIRHSSLNGGSLLKTGIFGNCVFATFSKNIKHLTFAGCQSEIPLNSSQLLSIPYESEVLLPICYQIFDDVLGRCQGVSYKKGVFYFGYLT